MVKLTFYGGVNEIGGNKILLEDMKAKVMLDFGQSSTCGTGRVDKRKEYFCCLVFGLF